MTDNPETSIPVCNLVNGLLENFDCQPVLFVGSGLARRYINAPDWEGALRYVLDQIGTKVSYEYLEQKHGGNKIAIGSDIAELAFEWAWNEGLGGFAGELYSSKDKSIFMKALLASHLNDLTPDSVSSTDETLKAEIAALKAIRPHALITTNYDPMLERVFEGYESIIGKQVLRYNLNAYGEVYHIHGSSSDPNTMVITQSDYDAWSDESKYFAAKLLTYFAEHPVFIFGYTLGDPNVQTILRDIGAIAADETGLIGNVVQVVWLQDPKAPDGQSEFAIPIDGNQYRIRVLNVTSLLDVFSALTARHELKHVNPALVRALAARLMKLTRKDIPSGNIEVDYATLERIAQSDDELPAVLGITKVDDLNKSHPHLLTAIGEQLGFKGWNQSHALLNKIKEETGIDIKATDNRYHCAVKVGKKDSSISRKYSVDAFNLLAEVRDGKAYKVDV